MTFDSYDQSTFGKTASEDGNGHSTTGTYDASGNPITQTNAVGATTTYSYNAFNEKTCTAQALAASPAHRSLRRLQSPQAPRRSRLHRRPRPSTSPTPSTTLTETRSIRRPATTLRVRARPPSRARHTTSTTGPVSDTRLQYGLVYHSHRPRPSLPCATIDADGVVTQLALRQHGRPRLVVHS